MSSGSSRESRRVVVGPQARAGGRARRGSSEINWLGGDHARAAHRQGPLAGQAGAGAARRRPGACSTRPNMASRRARRRCSMPATACSAAAGSTRPNGRWRGVNGSSPGAGRGRWDLGVRLAKFATAPAYAGATVQEERPLDHRHAAAAQDHAVAVERAGQMPAARARLIGGEAVAPEPLRPIGHEHRMRRSGHRILVDPGAGREGAADDVGRRRRGAVTMVSTSPSAASARKSGVSART